SAATHASDGSLWLAGRAGIFHSIHGSVQRIPLPVSPEQAPGIIEETPTYQAIAVDAEGSVWLSIAQTGLFRWKNGAWDSPGPALGLPAGPAIRLYEDVADRLWLAYPGDQIAMLEHGRVHIFNRKSGLAVGNVLAIYATETHTWVAGDEGTGVLIG